MEYLDGGSLKSHFRRKDLAFKEILDLAVQIGEGLNAAHDKGVVHRDVKPDNIMLTETGLPKIMDFGLAKLQGVTRLTRDGTTLGTLQYMSPEQATPERRSSPGAIRVLTPTAR
jgi:serine/threonine-protein kinase